MPYLINKLHLSSPHWPLVSRVFAAILGGYALATSSSLLISQLLQHVVGKYQAIHIGLMLTFIVYACAAMWVFSVASVSKAWLGLIKLTIFFTVATWFLMQFTGVTS